MKRLTREWLAKAEEDMSVAAGLIRRRRIPANAVCFHCQQAAEKLLKAFLQERNIPFGKTHDLEELLRLTQPTAPSVALLANDLQLLTDFAVKYRYPGQNATSAQARKAVAAMRRVRAALLGLLR